MQAKERTELKWLRAAGKREAARVGGAAGKEPRRPGSAPLVSAPKEYSTRAAVRLGGALRCIEPSATKPLKT